MARRGVVRVGVLVAGCAVAVAACSSGGGGDGDGDGASASTTASSTVPATTVAPFVFDAPVDVAYPPQPDGVPWPTDGWETGPLPEGADAGLIEVTLDEAFGSLSTGQNRNFDAALVVHDGRIVVERYRDGFGDEATTHRSWSMAKSITSILAGTLVRDGQLDIVEPAPVPEWSDPADPRHAITTEDLLHMASGLRFNENYFAEDSDTIAMLASDDLAAYAASKELEAKPGTRVQYSTGTANIIARIVGDLALGEVAGAEREAAYRAYIADALLDPLGIDEAEVDPKFDAAGNLNGGSAFDATARAFAKLGYLYLRGGTWDGHVVVPETWVDFSRTPLPPPVGMPTYGAQWWVDDDEPGVFRMGGFGGQHVVVDTERDLVVVVLSDRLDAKDGPVRDDLRRAFDGVAAD